MDKNTVVVKGSFKGISGEFIKNILILLCTFIVYTISTNVKEKYYAQFNITSFFEFVTKNFEEMKVIAILSSIFLLYVILAILGVSTLYKTITLLYETQKTITIDFTSGKILAQSYSFPFNKTVDENKFNEIINVNINQGLLSRLFNTGDLYVEYLTCSKIDSQVRAMEISYVDVPFKIKPRLL